MSEIHILSQDGEAFDFPSLKEKITIGRSGDNDVILFDNSVSRHHAVIVKTKDDYFLSDMGSFNGTRVNGKLVQNVPLKHGDEIKIGYVKLKFLTKEEKPAPSPADSVILTAERAEEKGVRTIAQSSTEESCVLDSRELLMSVGLQKTFRGKDFVAFAEKRELQPEAKADLASLERMNKVLFVLYEISRQLHAIHDFNELLKKIMDLIFMVIDADFGCVILTGDKGKEEFNAVIVKYKDDKVKDKQELKISRTIINRVVRDKVALLTSNAMEDSRLDHAQSLLSHHIRSSICVPLWRKDKIIGVIQLNSVRLINQFTEGDLELLKAIGCQMAMIIEQASLNEKIHEEQQLRSRLERFHSPQVIEMIIKGSEETKENIMEPKELAATILFNDIVGFTPLSEKMPPREVNLLLNQFFSRMTDIIFKYDGTLDKFIGDGLMAVFGAPVEKKDDAERAVRAALEMRKELEAMMEKIGMEKKFEVRIGINTGRVVAGNMGSPNRMEYTVIGDPVNIASRLESIAQPNQILIGEETYKQVKGKFKVKKIGLKKVKGRSSEILVYEVLQ
jgi:adenylate cyclase